MTQTALADSDPGVRRRQFLRTLGMVGAATVGVSALNPADASAFSEKELEEKLRLIGAKPYNIAIGTESASYSVGEKNLAVGTKALSLAGSKSLANVAAGTEALEQNVSGENNVAIGVGAGQHATGTGNVFVGYKAGEAETGSNKLYIANSATTEPLIGGNFETKAVTVHGALASTGALSGSNLHSLPGGNISVGPNALSSLLSASKVEQEKHRGNTALGENALENLTGIVEKRSPTGETSIGGKEIKLTGAAAKKWVTTNVPSVIFTKLPAGVTGLAEGVAYWLVASSETGFEVSATNGGTAITVGGAALKTSNTEMVLSKSTEDNTALGEGAGRYLVNGGGNVLVGENSGYNLTTGEENIAIGCESLASQQTPNGSLAIGFRALYLNTTGKENTAIGYKALASNTSGQSNVAIGFGVLEKANSAIGGFNLAIGNNAIGSAEGGSFNIALGFNAANAITTGEWNVVIGAWNTAPLITTGSENVIIGGVEAGRLLTTGSGNVFIGAEAGRTAAATTSNTLIIANNATTPLIAGTLSGTQKLGFYGVTPVARAAEIKTPSGESTAELKATLKALNEAGKNLGLWS
jgi:hypothetical protein